MNGTQTIQAIREAAPSNPEGIHANALERSGTTTQERIEKASRTLKMAEALLPAIRQAYGKNSPEAKDAQHAILQCEEDLEYLLAPNGGWA